MYKHPFRKSFGLIVLYSIIIIGIFVLQFRNESVVSKNIGLLSISFAQSQTETGENSLKNSLKVAFKGISFIADEVNPAQLYITEEDGSQHKQNLTLVSCEQKSPLSYTFNFTNGTSLTFSVTGTDNSAAFSISASLPWNASGLYLNYKPSSGFSVTERARSKIILNSKNLSYAFTAAIIDDTTIFLSAKNHIANYVAYNPAIEFSFASLDSDAIIAQKSTYETNLKTLRNSLVNSVSDSIKNNQNLSEKSVIAYIAEQALQGRYTEAVNYIPDSFKKGNKRTFLSAPYFNTLDAMYPTLEMYSNNMAEMISNAVSNSSVSIFSMDDFADYLNTLSDTKEIRNLLNLPERILETDSEEPPINLSQASGILNTYLRLSALHSNLAETLLPAAKKCLQIIESKCVLNDSLLILSEKDSPVSNFLSLTTGNALVLWGEFNNAPEYTQAGYAIINSILSINSLDSITLADIYPILVSNPYYPHFKVLARTSKGVIWAWTCSPSVSYSMQDNLATICVNFPKGEVNHLFIKGIHSFNEIEIYGLSFHSDPRFESYNSSGFIYNEQQGVLMLKSRHKTENETIRLSYKQ